VVAIAGEAKTGLKKVRIHLPTEQSGASWDVL
jgi:hypothetical protein